MCTYFYFRSRLGGANTKGLNFHAWNLEFSCVRFGTILLEREIISVENIEKCEEIAGMQPKVLHPQHFPLSPRYTHANTRSRRRHSLSQQLWNGFFCRTCTQHREPRALAVARRGTATAAVAHGLPLAADEAQLVEIAEVGLVVAPNSRGMAGNTNFF